MGLSYFVSSLTLLRNYSGLRCMPPAAASEEKRVWLGDTPDPGRRLRLLHLRCMPLVAASEEKRVWLGPLHTVSQTAFPRPRQETAPPAPPLQSACGGERRKKGLAGAPSHCLPDSVPQTPAGDCASCTSASVRLRRRAKKKRLAGAPSHYLPDSVPQTPAGGLRPPALPALDLTQRFSTPNMATAEPVPAVTFNRASAERRERQPST